MTNPIDIIRLVTLGAIWGSSFIFMRILAPVLAPLVTADGRMLLAAFVLTLFCLVTKHSMEWRKNWYHFLVLGSINSALPFTLYAFAASHIPAGYASIFNATVPLFGAVFSALWLNEQLTSKKIVGLMLGICGVAVVSHAGPVSLNGEHLLAVAACLGAALSLSLAAIYVKKFATHIKPLPLASGSLLTTGLLLSPALFVYAPAQEKINMTIVASFLLLGLLCTATAYLLYYRLIKDLGPTKATTVTFLIPIFCLLWATLFLGECITAPMLMGCVLIVSGTYLVMRA